MISKLKSEQFPLSDNIVMFKDLLMLIVKAIWRLARQYISDMY